MVKWMFSFGLGNPRCWEARPPVFGPVVVAKQTAKRAVLETHTPSSGYRTTVDVSELYDSEAEARAGASPRVKELAEYHAALAAEFAAAVSRG